MLTLDNFSVAFGEKTILESVSCQIRTPGCSVLLGPSGTGKSTLMRTLAGFNDANPALRTRGGCQLTEQAINEGNRPALVMQNSKLLISNVLENLVCYLPSRGELTRPMQIERIAPLLEQAECPHLLKQLQQKAVECSLGEQRIIAILRHALSGSPLLMVDEPTTGLQPDEAALVLRLLRRLAADRGVLVVLHNLIEAREIADQIVLLASGRVQEFGAAEAFFRQPATECGRIFLNTGSCPEASRAPFPIEEPLADPPQIAPTEAAPAVAPLSCIDPSVQPANAAGAATSEPVVSQSVGPRGFLWVLPGKLAGTPWPGIVFDPRYDLQALRTVGVTYLITLTEYPFEEALATEFGIRCIHHPMPDMQPPTEVQAWKLCEQIDSLIRQREVVAVHCRAGLGRTGTVLTAYWLWLARGRLSALKALEGMRKIEPLWVQSQSQVDFLEQFAESVARAASADSRSPTQVA